MVTLLSSTLALLDGSVPDAWQTSSVMVHPNLFMHTDTTVRLLRRSVLVAELLANAQAICIEPSLVISREQIDEVLNR